jgi:hypothetical protein
MPLDNEAYAGVANPIVALGNVHVQRCNEERSLNTLEEGLCITYAEECALSLCTSQVKTLVSDIITTTTLTDEDYGCLSQGFDGGIWSSDSSIDTHCWQAGELCGDLDSINITSVQTQALTSPGSEFCSDGIIV